MKYSINNPSEYQSFLAAVKSGQYNIVNEVGNEIFLEDGDSILIGEGAQLKKDYTIIENIAQFDAALKHIADYEILAFDTETTGLNVLEDKVIGFSFSGKIGIGYYLPMYTYNQKEDKIEKTGMFKYYENMLSDIAGKKLVMWNGSYDVRIVRNDLKLDLTSSLFCEVMLLKHAVDEIPPFGLKPTAVKYQSELGLDMESAANEEQIKLKENVAKNGGETTAKNYEMYKADLEVMGIYACADADLTLRLFELFSRKLTDEKLEDFFYNVEIMPLYKQVTIGMDSHGVNLNMPLIRKTLTEIVEDILDLKNNVITTILDPKVGGKWFVNYIADKYPPKKTGSFAQHIVKFYGLEFPLTKSGKYSITKKTLEGKEGFPVEFLRTGDISYIENDLEQIQIELWDLNNEDRINISSKPQMSDLVFNYMGIKPLSKTKGGKPQFDDNLISSLESTHDWARLLGNYNKLTKIKGSYIERFLNNHIDGKFYFYFKQHGTISGRYSSDAQQLPRPKEEGELDPIVLKYNNLIRSFFIANPGYVFIDADYESLEPHCVWEDSNIITSNNKVSNIKDVKIGDYILTEGGFKKVLNKWNSVKENMQIVTRKGVVNCSKDHKIYVKNIGWKIAGDLNKGDILQEVKLNVSGMGIPKLNVYLKGASVPFSKITITDKLSWMLGAFLGDGVFCTSTSKYVGICGLSTDGVTSEFKDIIESIGASPKRYDDFRTDFMESYRCHDSWLVDIFKKTFKLADDNGKIFRIPNYIMNSIRSIKLSFLAGLIDTDGTLGKGGSELSISTKSAELASDICTLGNSIDLDGRIGLAHRGDSKVYQVRFTAHSINRLIELNFKDYLICERKMPIDRKLIGKKYTDDSIILEINKSDKVNMVDITVDGNEEFICENIRVHNCFAHVSGDEGLRDIFRKGHDFYSTIAIKTEKLEGVSADKRADNYLGKVNKVKRQAAKSYCLGIPYGMEGFALGKSLEVPQKEAEGLIRGYLDGFPKLKEWMMVSDKKAQLEGYVQSEIGRIRHLPEVQDLYARYENKLKNWKFRKKLERQFDREEVDKMKSKYKNGLNNAKNFQIQSLGASIVNIAMIKINKYFTENQIDGKVICTVHDQIICEVAEDLAPKIAPEIERIMADCYELSIKLKAPAEIGYNWRDTH